MSADLISKRTRNAFREILVGWTLAEITTEFDNEGFSADLDHAPGVDGQRRTRVEQLYHRIDFSDPRHVSRLLEVYQTVVATARSLPCTMSFRTLISFPMPASKARSCSLQ